MTVPAVDVVTAGETMALLLADPPQPLRSAVTFRRSIAGAESNVAIGLARLGRAVRWIGVTGDDPLGDAIEALVRGEGVDVSYVRRDVAPTGLLVRDAPGGLPVQVRYRRRHAAGARLRCTHVPDAAVVGARMVHLTGITPALSASCAAAVEALARRGRAAGAEVFGPNHRAKLWSRAEARRSLDALSRLSDVVLVGMDEGTMLTGADSGEGLGRWFLERGVALVVAKHGAAGAWATDGGATAAAAARADAAFVVSPGLDAATVAAAHRYGMAALLGAASATEVVRALETGSDLVKMFPASALGMDTVRALGTALPQAPLVPTGGIEIADVPAWLETGPVAVGLGGRLVSGEPRETERRARQLVELLG